MERREKAMFDMMMIGERAVKGDEKDVMGKLREIV